MRVLFTTVGAAGHANPLIPFARHLLARGDEVLWATGPDVHPLIQGAGIPVTQAGPPFGDWMARLAARTRGIPSAGIPGPRKPHYMVPRLFCEVGAVAMIDDLLKIAADFRPDAVVFDSRCYAGPIVARTTGARHVLRAVTTLLPPEVEQLANDAIAPLWDQLGLGTPRLAGMFDDLVLSEWPASVDPSQPYGDLTVHRLAPAPAGSHCPEWLPRWLADQDGAPIVYATLGTAFSTPAPVNALLDAFDGADYSVVLTLGNLRDRTALRSVPPNVRVEQYVPQETLLPHCQVVVSHGGSGSTLGAFAHGLPHVVLPQGADQFLNAAIVHRVGAGIGLFDPPTKPQQIRDAVHTVLREDGPTARSQEVATEMHSGISLQRASELFRTAAVLTT
jgi:hypothetical protein